MLRAAQTGRRPLTGRLLGYLRYRLLGSNRLLRWVARSGGPTSAARILAFAVEGETMWPGEPNVLFILRNRGHGDLEALRRHTRLNWYCLPNGVLSQIERPFVPAEMARQTRHVVFRGAAAEKAREALTVIADTFLDRLSPRVRIDAIVSENIDYWQDLGLIRACRDRGMPFLTLCREHGYTNFAQSYVYHHYRVLRFKYEGTAIAVWGEATRQTFIKGGIAPADAVWVTGAPRFDLLRGRTAPDGETRCLTLLSFLHPVYGACNSFQETLAVFARQAASHGERGLRFVVKCRDGADADAIRQLLGEDGRRAVEVAVTLDLHGLLFRSKLVIGFNSTALLEALFTGAVLVSPGWGDALEAQDDLMIDSSRELERSVFAFPSSPDELESIIERVARGDAPARADRSRRLALFDRFVRFPEDTTCSGLAEAFVRHYLSATPAEASVRADGEAGRMPVS